ncbi:MAG: DUF2207 family protein [Ilumatobacteraceae bacterium]
MTLPIAFVLAVSAVFLPAATIALVIRRSVPPSIDPDTHGAGDAVPAPDVIPPAVVDVLTGGFVVEDDALPATIVDLAARGAVVVQAGPGSRVRLGARGAFDGGVLTDFERRVADRIRANSSPDGWATTEVFSGRHGVVSRRWWRRFVIDVLDHAGRLGLVRRRFGVGSLVAVWMAIVAGAASATTVTWRWKGWSGGADLDAPVGFVGMMAWVGVLGLAVVGVRLFRNTARVPTPLGMGEAVAWLAVRERMADDAEVAHGSATRPSRDLATAIALGLAPTARRELPLETDHDRHVWSTASGSWRRVRVRYVSLRPHWGYAPWWAVLTGGLQAVAFGCLHVAAMLVADDRLDLARSGLVDDAAGDLRGIRLVALVVAGVAAPGAAFGVLSCVAGVIDHVSVRTVEGVVIARRTLTTGHRVPHGLRWLLWSGRDLRAVHDRVRHHVAVDGGGRDVVLAHQVGPAMFRDIRTGARVRLRVTPLLGHVREVVEVAPPAESDDARAHGLIDESGASIDSGPSVGDVDIGDEPHAGVG